MQGEPLTTLPPDDVLLRDFLAGRDAPCPSCGYNLRGSTADRCPECATVLTLSLARATDNRVIRLAVVAISLEVLVYALSIAQWLSFWPSGMGSMPPSVWLSVGLALAEFIALLFCLRWVIRRARTPNDPGRGAMSAALWAFAGLAAIRLVQSFAVLVLRLL